MAVWLTGGRCNTTRTARHVGGKRTRCYPALTEMSASCLVQRSSCMSIVLLEAMGVSRTCDGSKYSYVTA